MPRDKSLVPATLELHRRTFRDPATGKRYRPLRWHHDPATGEYYEVLEIHALGVLCETKPYQQRLTLRVQQEIERARFTKVILAILAGLLLCDNGLGFALFFYAIIVFSPILITLWGRRLQAVGPAPMRAIDSATDQNLYGQVAFQTATEATQNLARRRASIDDQTFSS